MSKACLPLFCIMESIPCPIAISKVLLKFQDGLAAAQRFAKKRHTRGARDMNKTIWILLCLITSSLCSANAAEEQVKQPVVYKVPTSGKIIDVVYRIEFDEWWIKCREDNGIVVYTFDRDDQVWGKVRFEPKGAKSTKPADRKENQEKLEKDQQKKEPAPPDTNKPDKEPPPDSKKINGEAVPAKKDEPAPPKEEKLSEEEPVKDESNKSGRPWWDPLNILNKGKRLVAPKKEEKADDMPPIEPHNVEK